MPNFSLEKINESLCIKVAWVLVYVALHAMDEGSACSKCDPAQCGVMI